MQFIRYFLVLCCIWLSSAKAQDLNFININTDNGLPSNECYRIVQDKQGYIWVSTEMGLAKYNGREFILFDAAKGLPYRNIYALDADSSGRVWFATGDWKVGYILEDKIYLLNEINILESNSVKKMFSFSKTNIDNNHVYKMKYYGEGNMLYLSSPKLTVEVNFNQNIPEITSVFDSTLTADFIFLNKKKYAANTINQKRPLYGDMEKFPFVLSFENGVSKKLINYSWQNSTREIFESSVKVGTYLGINNQILLIKDNNILARKNLVNIIHAVYHDKKGNFYVCCRRDGLYIFDSRLGLVKHTLEGITVSGIVEDDNGSLWIATIGKGIYFLANKNVKSFEPLFGINSGLNFLESLNNYLAICNGNQSLQLFDKNGNSTKVSLNNNVSLEPTDILETAKNILISTNTNSFFFDTQTKKLIPIESEDSKIVAAQKIIRLRNNKIFLVVNQAFFEIENNKAYLKRKILFPKIRSSLPYGDNNILLASKNSIFKYNTDTITENIEENKNCKIAAYKNITELNRDSLGNIWALTYSDTIHIYNQQLKESKTIFLKKKNIACRKLLPINKRQILVSTNKGLFLITFSDTLLSSYIFVCLDQTNGLNSNDVYNTVKFNNKFYVSTSKGICIFDKVENLFHQSAPNTIISSIKVNDSCINAKVDTEFIYKRNNFAFVVDALTYKKINQKGTFFKYKLMGFDTDFKTADGNEITYNTLHPGTYTFIAKSFYDDETEDPTPATFTFTIKPPFWQTWWGILLMVLSGITIIFLIIEWRIKKIKKIEKEKAAINQTIAEYKFTALKAQMNPHFVFNSINVIQNLILEKDKQEAYNSLTTFSKLIRKILNQSDSVYSTVEDELELTRAFINLNKLRVDYPFEFFENVSSDALQCYIPSLIIQPFIENSLWHGILPLKGSKVGIIKLKISLKEGNILNIIIQDNGIGRKAASENKTLSSRHISKGLTLIKERLEAYRVLNSNCIADITITDIEDGSFTGTFVELNLELPHDE